MCGKMCTVGWEEKKSIDESRKKWGVDAREHPEEFVQVCRECFKRVDGKFPIIEAQIREETITKFNNDTP